MQTFYKILYKENPSDEHTHCRTHSTIPDTVRTGRQLRDKHPERDWSVKTVRAIRVCGEWREAKQSVIEGLDDFLAREG